MDNVLLFNNYEDLENSLKRLADTDHYTIKRVVAEPDWYYNQWTETYIFIMFLFVSLIEFRYNNKYKKLN